MSRPKGSKLSLEHRKKISEAIKGDKHPLFGKHHSLEARKKNSKTQLRIKFHVGRKRSLETKNRISEALKGKPKSTDAKLKMSLARKGKYEGKNHPNWQGGITPINQKIKNSKEYKLWREAVFKRDSFTCVFCKSKGIYLNADHIKPFSLFPELRFAIDNGRTLCVPCHKETPTFAGKIRHYESNI